MFQGRLGKVIAGVTLGIGLVAGSAAPALADNRDYREREKCEQRIRKAEDKLQHEINKHGRSSHQAESRRQDLRRVEQQCNWFRGHDRDDWRNQPDHDRR